MLHFEQRRCERHNREFNLLEFFYHLPLYIMMCENEDFLHNIDGPLWKWIFANVQFRVTWGKKPPCGKKPLLDIHKSKPDRKA